MTTLAPLLTHMTPRVVVSHVAVITILGLFYKGRHGSDHAIMIARVVHMQFVLHLVRSIIHNGIVEVP